jgi:alpha-galactosidase
MIWGIRKKPVSPDGIGESMDISFKENGLYFDLHVTEDGDVRLHNLSSHDFVRPTDTRYFRLVEVQITGMNQDDHHGCKHTGTAPGSLLRYVTHSDNRNQNGRRLTIEQEWDAIKVYSHFQFYDGVPVVRCWSEIRNNGTHTYPLEYLSSFALTGVMGNPGTERDKGVIVHIPHNTWYGEAQWKSYGLNDLGYDVVNDFSMKRIRLSNTGSWGTCEYLPMGSLENTNLKETVSWQIETSGSWNWELSDMDNALYLQLSGPSEQENHFLKLLKPEESFSSVPCAVTFVHGDFAESIRRLTHYRRIIRRPSEEMRHPPVIFNDYMNCLMGDPTTEKEYPLIDRAAELGCQYYCIDCGWYDDGFWWDGVGEWLPAKGRFPGGIKEILDYIRDRGMIPGLWLEIEVMGIRSPLVENIPHSWFFCRSGVPIIDHGRYQLDFRNQDVVSFADSIVDRLVNDYGVGYIKMDYNINAGIGTDFNADSAGEGLLSHTRAYLRWIDRIFDRYPHLVIENCGSGGMRMEYSLLSRHSIQSVTDQTDYLKMAAIACNCMTAVTPEQAAIWSYPVQRDDREEVVFNMVNAILFCIHQSGRLLGLSAECLDLIREGIGFHVSICEETALGLPFWPIGMATIRSPYCCVGVKCDKTRYLAVWNLSNEEPFSIPLPEAPPDASIDCAYPKSLPVAYGWDKDDRRLTLDMAPKTARIFRMKTK